MLTRRAAYAVISAAAALPRLAVLVHERAAITTANVDKGADFARTFLASGTYGFIPGHPSAYTQPLYGFFLIPPYWIFNDSWVTVGLAQTAVAVATAIVVYEVARRILSSRGALAAALLATLQPYLVWHDVHMNREILDQLLAAAAILLTLLCAQRFTYVRAASLGAVVGLAVLGNVRLLFLPVMLLVWILWQRRWARAALLPAGMVLVAAALVVMPWVVRNDASVGCWAVTTDGRALWKANNPYTYGLLTHGKWIDQTPNIPGAPITPQDAGALYRQTGRIVVTDECAQMRFYQHLAYSWMREHPGTKAKLALLGASWLWQPWVTQTEDRPGSGTWLDRVRSFVEPLWAIPAYALGFVGLFVLSRGFAVLALGVFAYQTLFAMLFVGETRYRVPWDFLLAILAIGGVTWLWDRLRQRA